MYDDGCPRAAPLLAADSERKTRVVCADGYDLVREGNGCMGDTSSSHGSAPRCPLPVARCPLPVARCRRASVVDDTLIAQSHNSSLGRSYLMLAGACEVISTRLEFVVSSFQQQPHCTAHRLIITGAISFFNYLPT